MSQNYIAKRAIRQLCLNIAFRYKYSKGYLTPVITPKLK